MEKSIVSEYILSELSEKQSPANLAASVSDDHDICWLLVAVVLEQCDLGTSD